MLNLKQISYANPCEARTATEKGIERRKGCTLLSGVGSYPGHVNMLPCCLRVLYKSRPVNSAGGGGAQESPLLPAELLATKLFWRRVLVCRSMHTGEPARLH